MYEANMGKRDIARYLMNQTGSLRFQSIAQFFWSQLYPRVMISMYEQGMSKEGIAALLDDMFEKYTNGASREEVLETCSFSPETAPLFWSRLYPRAIISMYEQGISKEGVAALLDDMFEKYKCLDRLYHMVDTPNLRTLALKGEERLLDMYERGIDRKEIQRFLDNYMGSFRRSRIQRFLDDVEIKLSLDNSTSISGIHVQGDSNREISAANTRPDPCTPCSIDLRQTVFDLN